MPPPSTEMRKPHKDPELKLLRDQILAADRALLAAFGERLDVVRRIREHKRERGYEMIDPAREDELYRRWRESAAPDISEGGLRTLFETVLDLSKQEAWRDGEPSA